MRRIQIVLSAVLLPLLALSACERNKSATPLSPSIAGPIEGVEISQPGSLIPAENVRISATEQPITFTVENAASNGVRPLSYLFEVATESAFENKVFSQTGITPGEDGRTSFQLPNALAPDRDYYWRARAYDGANEGEFSAPIKFTVFTPVVVGVPGLVNPADGATVTTRTPSFRVQNPAASGPFGALYLVIEVATDGAMSNRVWVSEFAADASGQTQQTVEAPLAAGTRFYWRARGRTTSKHLGDWSTVHSFVTPAASAPPPGGGGSGGGGGGGSAPAPNDQIDLRQVVFAKGANISGWAVTSTVTSAFRSGTDLCIGHTMAGRWPRIPWLGDPNVLVEGNQWFFAMINGRWHGGANEWLRPGQTCKVVDGHVGQGGFGGTAMGSWTPAPGELIGVAVSAPARAGQEGVAERSNVVLIRW